jgi:oligopeptide transport system ATP-binding protein
MSQAVLKVDDLKVHFPVQVGRGLFPRRQMLKAVDGVSFELTAGETLGVVGESGCGKSTLARAILRLVPATAGSVTWLGQELTDLPLKQMRALRQDLQVVFQDPLASLDPRMTVGDIIAEPLKACMPDVGREDRDQRVRATMDQVGLLPRMINRYPHEFSGGQCQRIGIARAIILNPKLVICDEPVSALDVSIQAQIINLINDLKNKLNISLIFISHDLSVVRLVSERVMVLYLGRVMELADRDSLYREPRHPYTQSLIAAVPETDPDKATGFLSRALTAGDLPSPLNPPTGCVFNTRCLHAQGVCREAVPVLESVGPGHQVACHLWRKIKSPV